MKRTLAVGLSRGFWCSLAWLAAMGCSGSGGVTGEPVANPAALEAPTETETAPLPAAPMSAGRPVLGKLQMHGRNVTLLGSRDGLRVTIEDDTGRILAHDASIDEVRLLDPLVYEACRSAVADNRGYLDARVYVGEPAALR
jgi:hypothetical protein